MATEELNFLAAGRREYEEPEQRALIHLSNAAWESVYPLPFHRIKIIEKAGVVLEPIQTGVLRYPPVRVQVPGDPEASQRYINMPPTDWSEIIHRGSTD